MMLHRFTSAAEFAKRVASFLARNEAENSLMLGAMERLAREGGRGHDPLLCAVEDEGEVVLAAMQTPPLRLVLTRAAAVAVAVLADDLARGRAVLPGVLGPTGSAEDFAAAWGKLSRQTIERGRSLRAYQASRVNEIGAAGGQFLAAGPEHIEMLATWHRAFREEVGEHAPMDDRHAMELAVCRQRVFLWRNPQPVSMSAWTGPTPNGVRINTVYTPPAQRRHGYARACVAALTCRLLESGRRVCFLFADVTNRTANRIYQRIGYEPVCEFAEFRFAEPSKSS